LASVEEGADKGDGGGEVDRIKAQMEEAERARIEAESKLKEANGRVDDAVSMLSALHERCVTKSQIADSRSNDLKPKMLFFNPLFSISVVMPAPSTGKADSLNP